MVGPYVLVMILGIVFLIPGLIPVDATEDAMALKIMGGMYLLMGLIFAAVFTVGLLSKRQSWAWIYNVVLICLGMGSCLFLPAAIPLLIHWLKPETKAWYGRS